MTPHHHLYALAWTAAGLVWVLCGSRALVRRAQPHRVCAWRTAGALTLCAAVALVGARLHFVLLSAEDVGGALADLVALGGDEGARLRITGGLLAALGVLLLLAPRAAGAGLGRAAVLDAVVPPAGLAIAIGRLGCFADGCCFGIPCAAFWCPRFPFASPAYWSHVALGLMPETSPASLPVHPLQVYLALAGLLALTASRRLVPPGAAPGSATLTFVAALAGSRALLEPLREPGFGLAVAYEVPLSSAVCAGSVVGLLLLARRARRDQRLATLRSEAS